MKIIKYYNIEMKLTPGMKGVLAILGLSAIKFTIVVFINLLTPSLKVTEYIVYQVWFNLIVIFFAFLPTKIARYLDSVSISESEPTEPIGDNAEPEVAKVEALAEPVLPTAEVIATPVVEEKVEPVKEVIATPVIEKPVKFNDDLFDDLDDAVVESNLHQKRNATSFTTKKTPPPSPPKKKTPPPPPPPSPPKK